MSGRLLLMSAMALLLSLPDEMSLHITSRAQDASAGRGPQWCLDFGTRQAAEAQGLGSPDVQTPEGETVLLACPGQGMLSLQRGWRCSLTCLSSDTSLAESVRIKKLVFGVDPAALDGHDSLDVVLPPISPGVEFEAYFADDFFGRLSTDIRKPSCKRIEWTIKTIGTDGMMRWHQDMLPAGQFELNGSLYGAVNMKEIPEAPFAGNAVLTMFVKSCAGVKGDVNTDGLINILDVLRVVNIILQIESPPTDDELWAADCYGDGWVNILDTLAIVNVILDVGECHP